jgi:hypothetical protein
MPDLIRITTPLVTKSPSVLQKNGPEPVDTFSLQNTAKISKPTDQLSEAQKQGDAARELSYTPALLLAMLKDPELMVSYLRNMNLFVELIKLMPQENENENNETRDILNSLNLKPDKLIQEMKSQEYASTAFKGESFDFLRKVSDSNWTKPEVQTAIAKFLQAAYNMGNQKEIANACVNNLSFLRYELKADSALSEKLDALISELKAKDPQSAFTELKAQTLEFLKEFTGSSLLSPKAGEIASIIKYNLSRSGGSAEEVTENALNLLQRLSPNEKRQFIGLFNSYMNMPFEGGAFDRPPVSEEDSKVISLITQILSRQTQSDKMSSSGSERLDTALHSLLMSPCNFTPLIHFILPLQQDEMKALAEVWINRERDEREASGSSGGGIHILMLADVEGVGRFEAEFYVYNATIDFNLYCPEGTETDYEELLHSMPKLLYGTEYHLGKTELAPLKRSRALADVFKSLPHRRVGVNVKV